MNTRRPLSFWIKWLLLIALVLGIALGVTRALGKRKATNEAAMAAAESLQKTPTYTLSPTDVVTVQNIELTQTIALSGSVDALQSAAIKAKTAGEIQGLSKREGDSVKAGEVVARIDSTEAQARVRQATRQAESAQAQVAIARRTFDNNQALVRQGFISNTALDTASANLASAEATHQAALAALDIARKSLADTTLRSPLTGQISARLVQNGERVGIDTRVLDVVDLSGFEMEAAIAPADAVSVQVGQTARLTIEGQPEPVEAIVARINPSVQAASRSVLVYLRVPALPGMRQGLFAQGHIVTGSVTALAVPISAVRNDKPQPYVQVVREGAVVHVPLQPGATGLQGSEPMRAVEGLPAGTQLLRAQAGLIREGTAVRLNAPATATATN
ncbi:efflux RND transporter periplasmic adaptor subunit [Hydrogenophaga sp.]|uniref:efflux RND transporter periplasmic adaptor subunit n=2 Tax=Hydrogenophaga sp. TaxID=1904254 RepID=UPI002732C4AF|nr:efflux RND transporter periplasmic adaptor subunit [Hydrogenophaga sp.]MDP3107282.1 efflux RND transporter periplasmic adaptor subunit [Hydrogenophaga sp.]MDP3348082.1 efflux RND transporter periplasmic adaptor subunit [Hydrogenophaga sp.]MDZ4399665.1 efflux RND transporter periplasmic adaptor subunit [Hydrogenophaga sp.]